MSSKHYICVEELIESLDATKAKCRAIGADFGVTTLDILALYIKKFNCVDVIPVKWIFEKLDYGMTVDELLELWQSENNCDKNVSMKTSVSVDIPQV